MTLVGYYPLDENSGTTAYDYSGNENHGTANGAGPSGTGTVAGPLNASAYEFDGTDDYITSLTFSSTPSAITISMWVKLDSLDGEIFAGGNNTNGDKVTFSYDGNSNVNWFSFDGSTVFGIDGYDITGDGTGQWQHMVASWDGSTYYLYFNSSQVTSSSSSTLLNPDEGYYIGARNQAGSATLPVDGAISDVRIYDRALSPQEIAYLYQVGQEAHLRTEVKSV